MKANLKLKINLKEFISTLPTDESYLFPKNTIFPNKVVVQTQWQKSSPYYTENLEHDKCSVN